MLSSVPVLYTLTWGTSRVVGRSSSKYGAPLRSLCFNMSFFQVGGGGG